MSSAAGYVLAAGGLVAANEAVFVPLETGKPAWTSLNWRIVPATALLALALTGMDKLAPGFGTGLGMLTLLAVLVIPVGNASTPLENAAKLVGTKS